MTLHQSPPLENQLEATEMASMCVCMDTAKGDRVTAKGDRVTRAADSPGNESLLMLVSILSTEEKHPTIT